MSRLLWEPSEGVRDRANLTAYTRWLEAERGLRFGSYEELWRWSVTELEAFWASLWEYFRVEAATPYRAVLEDRGMPGARWFPGAELSYARQFFAGKRPEAVALRHASELRPLATTTWGELRERTGALAAALRELGVSRGDRVGAYLPNVEEAVVGLLACASIGAIWSSCSPDFGARAVIDRFGQIDPKVLLTVDGYRYGGRDFDRLDVVESIRKELPGLEHTVLLPYLDPGAELPGAHRFDELLAANRGAELTFADLPFEHPLWILSSSGTTGLPKAIVQSQGGILLEHLKTVHFHLDALPGDRVLWFTTTGWMMWNLLVGVLLGEASIVLYDGSPVEPDLGALWDLAEATGVTCFGMSSAYVATCMKAGISPREGRTLEALRSVGATGSPLPPEGFRWIYDRLGSDTWLFSMSGGTDVCTAFVGGVPTLPVHEGELQGRALGAKVEAFDEEGRSVVGAVGELVLTEPLPSMPIGFWGDEDGSRYRESYFDMYPGVWRHGDWIELTPYGSAVIFGRSDSTINRGGVRIGTSEFYRTVTAMPEIADALVLDLPRPGTSGAIILFVVLAPGWQLDDALLGRIRRSLREECSPRHVPDEIRQVAELPRTLSGKLLEVPVKRILMGADPSIVASRDSLANPHALDAFVELAEAERT